MLPGLGQAFNGRRRLALWFLIPSLILIGIGLLVLRTQSTTRLVAWAVEPTVLGTLLTLNLALLAWRLVASGQAFLDTHRPGPTGRMGVDRPARDRLARDRAAPPRLALRHHRRRDVRARSSRGGS